MKSITQQIVKLIKESEEKKFVEAYERGFEAGKLYRELNGPTIKLVSAPIETEQEKRDRLVKQAKEFVKKHKTVTIMSDDGRLETGNGTSKYFYYTTDFHIKGNKVTAVVYGLKLGSINNRYLKTREVGRATCSPNDCFNRHIGEFIALHRALGLDVPQEYLDVPNPTELRFGNVVAALNDYPEALDGPISKGSKFTVVREISYRGSECQIESDIAENSIIIDDTESEPNV